MKAKLNLDVGCGENCQPGFVGMDIRKVKGVEIIHSHFPGRLKMILALLL